MRVGGGGPPVPAHAKRADLVADVDGMVDEALDRSRSGGLPGRVWRGLTARSVSADVPAQVNYSHDRGAPLRSRG